MSVFGGDGPGVKSVSFKNGDADPPGFGHRGMIVLEWLEERTATDIDGKPKFWNGPDGLPNPNTPIVTQPVLVWVPGPDGQGLRDPEVEDDFGVRVIYFEKSKDLTKKMGAAMKAGGRRGQLWPGDMISAWWTHKEGKKKIYQAEFQVGDARTQGIAAKAKQRHEAWLAAKASAPAAPNGNAGSTFADDKPASNGSTNGAATNGAAPSYAPPAESAEDPRGWSAGSAPASPPQPATVGGGLFD